jgi:hypothetical protein
MMTGCANVVFLKKKAEDVIKDHIDKPLIVARTEELVRMPSKECVNIKSHKFCHGY